jgi:hypothetical protein
VSSTIERTAREKKKMKKKNQNFKDGLKKPSWHDSWFTTTTTTIKLKSNCGKTQQVFLFWGRIIVPPAASST